MNVESEGDVGVLSTATGYAGIGVLGRQPQNQTGVGVFGVIGSSDDPADYTPELKAAICGQTSYADAYAGYFIGPAGVKIDGPLEVTGDTTQTGELRVGDSMSYDNSPTNALIVSGKEKAIQGFTDSLYAAVSGHNEGNGRGIEGSSNGGFSGYFSGGKGVKIVGPREVRGGVTSEGPLEVTGGVTIEGPLEVVGGPITLDGVDIGAAGAGEVPDPLTLYQELNVHKGATAGETLNYNVYDPIQDDYWGVVPSVLGYNKAPKTIESALGSIPRNTVGVRGYSIDGFGVLGESENSHGIYGESTSGYGVYGEGPQAGGYFKQTGTGPALIAYGGSDNIGLKLENKGRIIGSGWMEGEGFASDCVVIGQGTGGWDLYVDDDLRVADKLSIGYWDQGFTDAALDIKRRADVQPDVKDKDGIRVEAVLDGEGIQAYADKGKAIYAHNASDTDAAIVAHNASAGVYPENAYDLELVNGSIKTAINSAVGQTMGNPPTTGYYLADNNSCFGKITSHTSSNGWFKINNNRVKSDSIVFAVPQSGNFAVGIKEISNNYFWAYIPANQTIAFWVVDKR